jgi:small subunit ribosomal protein S14
MAKKSKIAKNEQRKIIVARHAEGRDASPTRVRNRDVADGRPRGYLRKFSLRVRMRQLAHNGELPGVSKSSW